MKSKIINRVRERQKDDAMRQILKFPWSSSEDKWTAFESWIRAIETPDQFYEVVKANPPESLQAHGAGQPEAANPMIRAALDAGEDATGLCTVRELVLIMLESASNQADTTELYFPLPDGRRVNVEVRITRLEERA